MLGPEIDPREVGALPKTLDAADVERLRAQGWSITPTERKTNYRTNWTLWHAFREAAQNGLDATGHVEVVVDDSRGFPVTFISDDGSGFGVDALYLGERKGVVGEDAASKEEAERQKHCLRGHYGEGMKLGVMPILQAGGAILIRTAGLDATWVEGDFEEAGQTTKVLLRLVRRNSVARGTTVAILGLDATRWNPDPAQRSWPQSEPENGAWVDMRMRALPTLAKVAPQAILFTAQGVAGSGSQRFDACKTRQLLDLPGHLFVRDLWVEHRGEEHGSPMRFGYNFWFDDVLGALGGDRDRLQLHESHESVQGELQQLVCRMPEDLLVRWLDAVLVHDPDDAEQQKRRRLFEHRAFQDQYISWPEPGARGTDAAYPARILAAIRTVLRVRPDREVAWSTTTAQKDELVHRHVFDLADRVPDGFRRLLEEHKLVRPAQEIIGALSAAARWVIDPNRLARILRAMLVPTDEERIRYPDGTQAQEARRVEVARLLMHAFKVSLALLEKAAREMTEDDDVKIVAFVADRKDADLRGVAGIWIAASNTVLLRLEALGNSPESARETWAHELGHKISGNAADKSDEHAAGIARVGDLFARWSRKNPRAYDRMHKALAFLSTTPRPLGWMLRRTRVGEFTTYLSNADDDIYDMAVKAGLLRTKTPRAA